MLAPELKPDHKSQFGANLHTGNTDSSKARKKNPRATDLMVCGRWGIGGAGGGRGREGKEAVD